MVVSPKHEAMRKDGPWNGLVVFERLYDSEKVTIFVSSSIFRYVLQFLLSVAIMSQQIFKQLQAEIDFKICVALQVCEFSQTIDR